MLLLGRRKEDGRWVPVTITQTMFGQYSGMEVAMLSTYFETTRITRWTGGEFDRIMYSDSSVNHNAIMPYNPLAACCVSGGPTMILTGVLGDYSRLGHGDLSQITREYLHSHMLWIIIACAGTLHAIDLRIEVDMEDPAVHELMKRYPRAYHQTYGVPVPICVTRLTIHTEYDDDARNFTNILSECRPGSFSGCRYCVSFPSSRGRYGLQLKTPLLQALTVIADDETKMIIMSQAAC